MLRKIAVILSVMLVFLCASMAMADEIKVSDEAIKANTDTLCVEVNYPVFSGFKGADELNSFVATGIFESMRETMETEKANIKEDVKRPCSFYNSYVYSKAGDLVSYCGLLSLYAGGNHPNNYLMAKTVDMNTGKTYAFKDLFANKAAYKKAVALILEKVKTVDGVYDEGLDMAKKMKDYKYFLCGSNIIVYFDEYDIAPYAAGRPQFEFAPDDLKDLLKADIYQKLISAEKETEATFNGANMYFDNEIKYDANEGLWLPLGETAKLLDVDEAVLKKLKVKDFTGVQYVNAFDIASAVKKATVAYGDEHPDFYIYKADRVLTPAEYLAEQ